MSSQSQERSQEDVGGDKWERSQGDGEEEESQDDGEEEIRNKVERKKEVSKITSYAKSNSWKSGIRSQ